MKASAVSSSTAIFLLFATLIGSFFNIPITELPPEHAMSHACCGVETDMVFTKEAESHNDRIVASTQQEIRRLARNGDASRPEAASSISSGLSIVGKIIGRGALTIFSHVEGEVCASTVVIAEGAQMLGDVVAEELTINGHVKGISLPEPPAPVCYVDDS